MKRGSRGLHTVCGWDFLVAFGVYMDALTVIYSYIPDELPKKIHTHALLLLHILLLVSTTLPLRLSLGD